jgi:hypothetical protein
MEVLNEQLLEATVGIINGPPAIILLGGLFLVTTNLAQRCEPQKHNKPMSTSVWRQKWINCALIRHISLYIMFCSLQVGQN